MAEQKQPLPKEFLHEANGVKYFRSPGLATLNVGKARDGYWDGDNFLLQTEDVLDVLEAWLPDIEFLVEIDHSSGHDKYKPNGLNVYRMNANFGGQQAFIRTSEKLTAECLGDLPGRCLNPGDDQSFVFGTAEGTPPPFKKPMAPLNDYAGKQKGAYQILYERGLFDDAAQRSWMGRKDANKAHIPGSSWREVLAACPDFKAECSLLFQLVMDRGHSILSSPKCHPEVAGDGIEYAWGHSKRMFRKDNVGTETQMRQNQRKRVFASISAEHLPLERLMRFSRRAREYKVVYRAPGGGVGDALSHVNIETERKAQKLRRTHVNHRAIDSSNLTD